MGFPFKEFLYDLCGGPLHGRKFKAVIPGGASVPIQTMEEAEATLMDYEGFVAQGSMLGSGGVIVIDDAQSMVSVIARIARFFAHESCAQCTQCREGTAWTTKILERIRDGEGTIEDLDTLLDIGEQMTGKTICVLSDSCAVPVVSGIKKFRPEFESLIRGKRVSLRSFGGRVVAEAKMVNLTIEGRPVSVPEGTSILEAAKTAGILIPHYCYHPGLPVAGVCRMCLVEVEKAPKLAPSCATTVAEGQVVRVHSEKSLDARKGVLEMLLINHPLDCPICDQSGECELQDYTFPGRPRGFALSRAEALQSRRGFRRRRDLRSEPLHPVHALRPLHGRRRARSGSERQRARRPRADWQVRGKGPDASVGRERRRSVPGRRAALKDFLNKARAWELDRVASICAGLHQGCNITIETRDLQVAAPQAKAERGRQQVLHVRSRPAELPMDESHRPAESPMVRTDGKLRPIDWDVAVHAAASVLRDARVHVWPRRIFPTKPCTCCPS